jgi:hypothetical protein
VVNEVLPTGLDFVPLLESEAALAQSSQQNMCVALAVTGKEFALIAEHLPYELKRLAVCGAVFARMSPDQKTQLIHTMQEVVRRLFCVYVCVSCVCVCVTLSSLSSTGLLCVHVR